MNIFVRLLSEKKISPPKRNKVVIEDNVGESIHIHISDVRLEMSVNEFLEFSNKLLNEVEEWE